MRACFTRSAVWSETAPTTNSAAVSATVMAALSSLASMVCASVSYDFATAAANQAMILQAQMSAILSKRK